MPDWGPSTAPQVAPPPPRTSRDLVPALAVLLLGIVLLDGMAACVRLLSDRYHPLELSAWRNLVGMIPPLVVLWWMGDLPRRLAAWVTPRWRLALGRGLMVSFAQLSYYIALTLQPFALVAALGYTMNLFLVALSIPILGERVGAWRWTAVFVGFAGAVWILRPSGADFSLAAALPLVAAALYAASMVTVRLFHDSVPNAMLYLYSSAAALVSSVLLVLATTGFGPVQSFADAAAILAMGLLGGCGVLCMLIAVRMAEPSKLAPFNYLGLLSAFGMGWLFFGEAPFDALFPGVLLLVGGGLIILWRERVNARRRTVRGGS